MHSFVRSFDNKSIEHTRGAVAILEKMQFGRVKLEDGRTMMAVAGQPTEVEIGPLNIKNS